MNECLYHKRIYHTFCQDCMLLKMENNKSKYETVYGAGPADSYYPPNSYASVPEGVEFKDMVNSPSHYTQGNIECIEAIAEVVKHLDGMEAMCTGNAIKYLWRWKHKNGTEDLKKAVWYIQRMIDEFDTN